MAKKENVKKDNPAAEAAQQKTGGQTAPKTAGKSTNQRKKSPQKPRPTQANKEEKKPASKKKPAPKKPAQTEENLIPPSDSVIARQLDEMFKKRAEEVAQAKRQTAKKPAQQRSAPKQTAPKQTAPKKQPAAKPASQPRTAKKKAGTADREAIRIIPLGGLNEIGKNMTVYECRGDMFLVDCGLAFPDADMLGVDIVIPDFTFVEQNIQKIKGLFITHGHEDHIGAIPYLLKKVDLPIYGSRLALGLIKGKLKEHGLSGRARLVEITPRQTISMGCMTVEPIRVNHSIPDAMAFAIHSPAGTVVQTGDFKIDYTPIEGEVIDLARFAELGEEGVLCLLSDSTNAERPGSTMSERKVGQSFQGLFSNAEGRRIIIASFSSNIHRIQQIFTLAHRFGRKVAVSGRSMENVVNVAMELGYLTAPKDLLVDMDQISRYPKEKTLIITTGSQGEPMSALSRMASGEHRKVQVTADDFIIISATPIPGNEKHVTRVVNDLLRLGAEVVYEAMYEVHVSGHACQDELRTLLAMTKPRYFIPVHGEYKHLKAHSKLALQLGIPEENIHLGEIGQVIQLNERELKVTGGVEAGRVLVDGLGVGDVGAIVLRDRQHLAQDGLIVVAMTMESATGRLLAGPDIVSRGFVYVRESEELMAQAKEVVKDVLARCANDQVRDWSTIKMNVRDGLSNFIFKRTKRGPMILPIITEL